MGKIFQADEGINIGVIGTAQEKFVSRVSRWSIDASLASFTQHAPGFLYRPGFRGILVKNIFLITCEMILPTISTLPRNSLLIM